MEVHELGFLERKENVIFLGPPGVGKTHLAISLAIAAAQSGRRVYYGALADLITSLEEAKTADQLGRRLKILTYPSLLVIDEIGYLPVTQTGAMLFFQLINRRYERASTVLTSNKGFEEALGRCPSRRQGRRPTGKIEVGQDGANGNGIGDEGDDAHRSTAARADERQNIVDTSDEGGPERGGAAARGAA